MVVLAHLPRDTFWCAGRGREGSHMTRYMEYGESSRFDMNQASGRTNRAFRDDPDVPMLLNAGFRNPEAFGARLLYASDRNMIGRPEERFCLYGKPAR